MSKEKVQALKKQQQALRRQLRSLERFLLRRKNHAALAQVKDLRNELMSLDARNASATETLRSLQEEITALRIAVSKKGKRGG